MGLLDSCRQASAGTTPEGLVQRVEEETKVNTYIVTQKLPKELESKRKAVESLQQVTNQPALGQEDINDLKRRIKEANQQINELTEKRNVTNDPMEDKLTLFRYVHEHQMSVSCTAQIHTQATSCHHCQEKGGHSREVK